MTKPKPSWPMRQPACRITRSPISACAIDAFGADRTVPADAHLGSDHRIGADHGAGADLRFGADHGAGIDGHTVFEARARMDDRARGDTRRSVFARKQGRRTQCVRKQRAGGLDEGVKRLVDHQQRDPGGTCSASRCVVKQAPAVLARACAANLGLIQEHQIARAAAVEGGDAGEGQRRIGAPTQIGAGELCNLRDGDPSRALKKRSRAHATPIVPRPPARLRTSFRR